MRVWLEVLPSVFVAIWLYSHTARALKEAYRKGHDGSTVARMLARIGEGTAHFVDCTGGGAEECEVVRRACSLLSLLLVSQSKWN